MASQNNAREWGLADALPAKIAYPASPIKRRRATLAEMEERGECLSAYAREHHPGTVRGLYYQAEVAGVFRLCRTSCEPVNPSVWAVLDGPPEHFARGQQ